MDQSKIAETKRRVEEWVEVWEGKVYVSFSGGKDSTVLLDLVRSVYPECPAVFLDTGLEFPEIRKFVGNYDNVTWLKPKMNFNAVIEKFGYPVISKPISERVSYFQNPKESNAATRRYALYGIKSDGSYNPLGRIPQKWTKLIHAPFKISPVCCDKLKKEPVEEYESETGNVPILGMLKEDSFARGGLKCNVYDSPRPISNPLYDWTEEEIWEYLQVNKIPYSTIYYKGWQRTGCMFCLFGIHHEGRPNRFQMMYRTHPPQWRYCIYKLGIGNILDWLQIPYIPKARGFFY